MNVHQIFAKAVTFSQITIAIAAITVLTREPGFWIVSLVFGAVGLGFLLHGLWLTYRWRAMLG